HGREDGWKGRMVAHPKGRQGRRENGQSCVISMLVQGKLKPAKKLTREDENRLVGDWVHQRNEEALMELFRAENRNIAFLAKAAHRKNKNISEEDFQQVAAEAFIKCLDKYEP